MVNEVMRELRERSGLSQEALARRVDTTTLTIGDIERGKQRPRVDLALRIATELGCSVEELFGLGSARG